MKLLITESENFSPKAIADLRKYSDVDLANIKSRTELISVIPNYDAVFIRLDFMFDEEILKKAPKLKYILSATTGLDHIDTDHFESTGGKIISLRGETEFLGSIPSTAEHTWALLLALMKRVPSSFSHVKEGKWNRNLFKGNNLHGKKLGILGLGRVGKQVANFAKAFGMEVGFYDTLSIQTKYQKMESAIELFKWADIITIHIPYSAENVNFVGRELLEHCKHGAIIINTSRGGIWDEAALSILMKAGKLKGIATDVLSDEFSADAISENELVRLANQNYNVVITPHIAGATFESMKMTEEFVAQQFLKILK